MSHPSLFPSAIPTAANPTRTVQFARRLNGLLEMRQADTLTADEFRSLVIDLGVPAETAWFMELAIAGGLAPVKADELQHEYGPCIECNGVDGDHTGDCLAIN